MYAASSLSGELCPSFPAGELKGGVDRDICQSMEWYGLSVKSQTTRFAKHKCQRRSRHLRSSSLISVLEKARDVKDTSR